ncbi:hypothetical protein OG742_09795 [Streptomyces sp. NBC_00828]|uniref:hypothetical protein n=1 Tax=Streptomyces sp. NBC_00828 TaxID=2903678 RepID=UPI0038657502
MNAPEHGALSGSHGETDARAYTYALFLETSDTEIWLRCLERARSRVAGLPDGDELSEALAEALCIAVYTRWLGRVSGDLPAEEAADRRYDELRDTLARCSRSGPSPALRTCWGLVLGASGYPRSAARLLDQDGHTRPEHLLLVLREGDVAALTALRPLFTPPARCRFLPVVHTYGSELVKAGAVGEAQDLIAQGLGDRSDPLLLDLLGSAAERLGQWTSAYEAYRRSPWPTHRHRAAMTGAISDAMRGGTAEQRAELVLDEPTRRLMNQPGAELDQSEIPMCVAFLNACRMRPVDNWVVERELGELSFRRRLYAEADLHFRRALRSAPDEARFAVASLRFTNLTWLTDSGIPGATSMVPEAYSAGREALDLNPETSETAAIRTWIAQETGNHALIQEALDTWDPYWRAEAHDVTGHRGPAVDGWLESLGAEYNHRSVGRLVEYVSRAGFTRTALHLAELVLDESGADFFALWETARTLQDMAPERPEIGAGQALDDLQDSYRQRLGELSRFEFKNTIRLYRLIARTGRHHAQAEELLLQAARQAEGVSELLSVAILRRNAKTPQSREEGLRCLERALGEARDRLEWLEVARELFEHGRIRSARAVLAIERVLLPTTVLTPVEVIVTLQCGSWLTAAECEELALRGAGLLNLDHRSGRLSEFGGVFGERLIATIELFDRSLAQRVTRVLDPPLRAPAVYADLGYSPDSAQGYTTDWPTDYVRSAFTPDSFGGRLDVCATLWRWLHEELEDAHSVMPSLGEEQTPLSRVDERGDSPRTIELCDLWRARLTASDDEFAQASAGLEAFFDRERTLMEWWESARRRKSEPPLRRALRCAEELRRCLGDLLGPEETHHAHPVLRTFFGHIALEAGELRDEVAERTRRIEGELVGAHGDV